MADVQNEAQQEEDVSGTVPEQEQEALKLLVSQSSESKSNEEDKVKEESVKDNLGSHLTQMKMMYPYRVPRLDDICVAFIGANFNEYPILDCIPAQYVENVVNLIDLSKLLINRASKHVECSKLWERMSCERWENCRVELHGSSWKRLYLEKHIKELVESYYPSIPDSNINLNRLLKSIKCSSPFIHSIKLDQLPSHLDLSQILPLFNNLSSLDITYKVLNVGMNYNAEDFGMNLNDALNISKYLHSTKSLSTLILSECLIDDETVHILMGGLQQNNTITTLNLSYNKITSTGARRLSSFLTKNDNVLMILNLNDNQINDEGVQFIAETLKNKDNSHLIELNVALNNIGDSGAAALMEAAAISECLQILDISKNRISTKSFESFLNLLQINSSMHTLNISGNPLISAVHSSAVSTASRSISATNSRPASRLSQSKSGNEKKEDDSNQSSRQHTFRSVASLQSDQRPYAKELEMCLLNDNQTMIELNVAHCGLTKLEMKTITKILQPRKVRRKQAQRKAFIDKSWARLQTVLQVK